MGYMPGMAFKAEGMAFRVEEMLSSGEYANAYCVDCGGAKAFLKEYKNPSVLPENTPWFEQYAQLQTAIICKLNAPPLRDRTVTIRSAFVHKNHYHQLHAWQPGRTLRALIADGSLKRDARLLRRVLAGVTNGVAAVHAAGIVHSDLKPENVLVCSADGTDVRIIDFDWSFFQGRPRPWPSGPKGTIGYLSYEHMKRREPTQASDIFTLGIIAYEAITGRLPYHSRAPGPFQDDAQLCAAFVQLADQYYYEDMAIHGGTITGAPVNQLLKRCFAPSPGDRPKCNDLTAVLGPGGASSRLRLVRQGIGTYVELVSTEAANGNGWLGREKCRIWGDVFSTISSHQADFGCDPTTGRWWVDLPRTGHRPRNGTWVGPNALVGRTEIKYGDVITIGSPDLQNSLRLQVEISE